MLSSILPSKRSVAMNILITRAFVRLRELLATHKDLARKMEKLEQRQTHQAVQINTILKHLIEAPKKPKHPIGFVRGQLPLARPVLSVVHVLYKVHDPQLPRPTIPLLF